MADDITAPGAGTSLATRDIGGRHYPRNVLVTYNGTTVSDVGASNPLPVAVSGGATSAKQDEGTAHLAKLRSPRRWFTITPADSNLSTVPDLVYVGGDGNLVLRGSDNVDATFKVFAGQVLEISPTQVRAASTATGLVGLAVPG